MSSPGGGISHHHSPPRYRRLLLKDATSRKAILLVEVVSAPFVLKAAILQAFLLSHNAMENACGLTIRCFKSDNGVQRGFLSLHSCGDNQPWKNGGWLLFPEVRNYFQWHMYIREKLYSGCWNCVLFHCRGLFSTVIYVIYDFGAKGKRRQRYEARNGADLTSALVHAHMDTFTLSHHLTRPVTEVGSFMCNKVTTVNLFFPLYCVLSTSVPWTQ